MTDLHATINDLYAHFSAIEETGALYPPTAEPGEIDPAKFAIAIVTTDGATYAVGDSDHLFALQSISKIFTFGLALEDHGCDYLLTRIGVEPTGTRYNAIVLDEATGRPYNPMVNAGAIAIADIIKGDDLADKLKRIVRAVSAYAGRPLIIDGATFAFESQFGHRNRAIAHLLRASNGLHGDIDDALHLYFHQCSLLVNTVEMATMAATLANRGQHPLTGEQVIGAQHVRDVLSVMYTCGMYDSSGEWVYNVGLPAKSGVSGGILAVVPGQMGIATFAPPLDHVGHSIRGLKVFRALSDRLNFHVFNNIGQPPAPPTTKNDDSV